MSKIYKTPLKRLCNFFEDSRDNWKNKTLEVKAELKNTKKKFKYTKEKLSAIKTENSELKKQLHVLELALESEKKMMY